MNKNEQNKEYVMEEVLRLHDDGKSQVSIIDLYPQYKEDIIELFETIDSIAKQGDIEVPELVLQSILKKVPDPSSSSKIISPFYNIQIFHNIKRFGIVSTLTLVLVVGGGFLYNQNITNVKMEQSHYADIALENDIQVIDSKLIDLDMETANLDDQLQ